MVDKIEVAEVKADELQVPGFGSFFHSAEGHKNPSNRMNSSNYYVQYANVFKYLTYYLFCILLSLMYFAHIFIYCSYNFSRSTRSQNTVIRF